MPECDVKGLRLSYELRGDPGAPPMVLVPSLGGTTHTWAPVARRLERSYRLLLMDPRDAGRSGRAAPTTPQAPTSRGAPAYAIADMAADVAGLMAQLRIGPAAVAGLSMGGAIAQELAIGWPDLVSRLVLIATYDAGDPRGAAIFRQFARLRRILSREDYQRTLLPWVYTCREYETAIDPEETVQRLAQDPFFQEPEAYERQMEATIAFHSRDRLGRIVCPTLLLFGDEDLFTPMRFARSLNERIRGSRLAVLAGAGHGLVWTRSAEVAALIDAFLQEEQPAQHRAVPDKE